MTVRELLQMLLDHALDGRGSSEEALVQCDGGLREISSVETRIEGTGQDNPSLFVLVVADGPSETVEASSYSPHV